MPKTPHSSRGPSRSSRKGAGRGDTQTGEWLPCERPARRQASKGSGGETGALGYAHGPPPPRPGYARRHLQLRNGISMATHSPVQIPRQRLAELIAREEQQLNDATQKSQQMSERARVPLSGGVASSYQLRDPWPIYLERGIGPRVWDVDGNAYSDFHNGFGSMVQGHAHPAIGKAISERYALGTHFAAPTEDAIVVGEELARRWGLPKWRFTNSGSESTMDAIRIARGHTGRDTIVKIFGSYHGHHDGVMV